MDLISIPVLDNHCHFFATKFDPDEPLHRFLTLSLNDMPDDQLHHTLLYRHTLSALARLLKSQADETHVLEARRRLGTNDYQGYVRTLMEDVHMGWMLVDIGLQRSSVDFGQFEALMPCPVHYVYRIETVVDRLWREGVSAGDGVEQFRHEVREAVRNLPAVALKSIIGYRTGLEIDPAVTVESVEELTDEATYRNLFILEAVRICREFSIPLHLHAAFGESNIDVRRNNPLHMKAFLDSPGAKDIDIVLIHGGYPYAFEGGYLAAMYPNVYIDISEFIPFASMGMQRGVEDIMSMCPMNKIMYGSDGFDVPETHWYGARAARELLTAILDEMVSTGKIGAAYAEEIAHMVLYRNSKTLHRIP
jgi:uncharacterized protein